MGRNLINSSQFDSLAANASQDSTRKMASVASVASAAIRELAKQMSLTDSSINVAPSTTEPSDNLYWFYVENTGE